MQTDRFKPLEDLYTQMDQAWNSVAAAYGFQCNGCEDNCCQSLFYHHTQVEKSYLKLGFNSLPPELRQTVLERSQKYIDITFQSSDDHQSKKIMCPVNEQGQCLLYHYRPMICRLHGLPHELCRPGGLPVKGPGCNAGNFNQLEYIRFDRTPFYAQMARVEMNFRTISGDNSKIKETVAHMLLS